MTSATTREKPILFSGPMVKAILDGRKTQTRRVIKPQPDSEINPVWIDEAECFQWATAEFRRWCPYGLLGDRLWVRETWMQVYEYDKGKFHALRDSNDTYSEKCKRAKYKATDTPPENFAVTWRPSIHMPRWASRITLEITDVRVERLQSISEEDARAEGFPLGYGLPGRLKITENCKVVRNEKAEIHDFTALGGFARLWDALNGNRLGCSWKDSPWVWAITFRRLTT